MTTAQLTLGPILFNWPGEAWRDFYFRMADEAPVDTVVLGEVVCSKRAPFFADHMAAALERLQAAGKEVVLASPALVADERDRKAAVDLIETADVTVEANDVGALRHLAGRPHHIGPFVNTYNETTLAWLAGRGAVRASLPAELPQTSLAALARVAAEHGVALEVQVFGRLPLAISARCYHARAHGLHKDGCQFVCGRDPDGMPVDTLDGEAFLAVNGTQTLSNGYLALVAELPALQTMGIRRFRLSPHSTDMVRVAEGFRAVLEERREAEDLLGELARAVEPARLANGFYHGREGVTFAA